MEYKVIRSNIKNIYIQVKDGEVIVKAPKKVSEKYIKEVVEKKEKWIKKKLEEDEQIRLEKTCEKPITKQKCRRIPQ